ncbi:hypothetical protein PI125_g25934 [Phytophthora idaei]|nr:hypothetical protein PI125_g25934 [Phytophthora idaei]KAG3123404.1 hypothetical protein PI126_g23726 [Phytophthora idaei]
MSMHEGAVPTTTQDRNFSTGVSAILSTLPPLLANDSFVDIGSGIGNVVAQAAIDSGVGQCVGIEHQNVLGQMSDMLIRASTSSYLRMSNVSIYTIDIGRMSEAAYTTVKGTSFLFLNNIMFDPTSNEALEELTTALPTLVHIVVMAKYAAAIAQAVGATLARNGNPTLD